MSEDEANEESDAQDSEAQLEIVTECWVEPQAGTVCNSPHERRFFEGLDYQTLSESVSHRNLIYLLDRQKLVSTQPGFQALDARNRVAFKRRSSGMVRRVNRSIYDRIMSGMTSNPKPRLF